MRLIDADALKNKLCEDCFGDCTRDCYEAHLIKAQPTIEAEPIRRGRWIREPNCWYRCTVCGDHYPSIADNMKYNYCPNCGARMEEQE